MLKQLQSRRSMADLTVLLQQALLEKLKLKVLCVALPVSHHIRLGSISMLYVLMHTFDLSTALHLLKQLQCHRSMAGLTVQLPQAPPDMLKQKVLCAAWRLLHTSCIIKHTHKLSC